MRVLIGVTTYGVLNREEGLLLSYWNNVGQEETKDVNVQLLVVDDGTPNQIKVREREGKVRRLGADFIANETNLGIPASWNVILNYGVDKKFDIAMILNDDIRFISPGVIERMVYFYKKNPDMGMVGFPLINPPETGFKENDPRWTQNPGVVGCAVGCSWFIDPNIALKVNNPDGSKGLWSDLRSFHEELTLGFELHRLGYLSIMLPYPPLFHQGGATFQTNNELIWRTPSPYLPMEEFLHWQRQSPLYIQQLEDYYAKNIPDRMAYARIMFAKRYGLLEQERFREFDGRIVDCIAEPQIPVHKALVKERFDRTIYWLDKSSQGQSCQI